MVIRFNGKAKLFFGAIESFVKRAFEVGKENLIAIPEDAFKDDFLIRRERRGVLFEFGELIISFFAEQFFGGDFLNFKIFFAGEVDDFRDHISIVKFVVKEETGLGRSQIFGGFVGGNSGSGKFLEGSFFALAVGEVVTADF